MKVSRFFFIITLLTLTAVISSGCSLFFPRKPGLKTRIIAVPWGLTQHVKQFKVGGSKPGGHVIWGNDIPDGSQCSIVITNIMLAERVYRRDFVYRISPLGKGYIYYRGRIVEIDPYWYKKIGTYLVELYVDGRPMSNDTFYIRP
ncbi:hypothetical protein ACFL1R_07205 [Candidatus Latescibacterota bacterium]